MLFRESCSRVIGVKDEQNMNIRIGLITFFHKQQEMTFRFRFTE